VLTDDDGIIIGASSAMQVSEMVGLIRRGPLPADVLMLTEELWDAVKGTRGEII
jgi:aflatoxin B1 aldehyde reductase